MKRFLLTLAVLMVSITAAFAAVYTGKCGTNVSWTLDTETGVLKIEGTGEMNNYTSSSSNRVPWSSNRSYVKEVQIAQGVTNIGWYAFEGCSSLTSIAIPEGVTSIGNSAFYNCSSLTSITIPSSVTSIGMYAFDGCSSLASITIPESVTSIGSYAFYGCSALTSVNIPEGVTSIGSSAFGRCSSLTSITIPNSVTSIGMSAFEGCSSLTSITIPSSVTSIGSSAFNSCPDLISINVDPNNTVYDSRDNCNAIIRTATNTLIAGCKSTTIPSSVTSIGDDAFSGCSSLTSIIIPESVTSIGMYAFYDCSSLTSVTIPEGVKSIESSAFQDCSSLSSVTIPSSVKSIGSSAFCYCSSLTSVTIPNSVTSIGRYAFYYCSSLTSITIPSSVTSIGDHAFDGCTSLTSINIPEDVHSIGDYAFYNCSSLTSITCMSVAPPTLYNNSFSTYVTLHVLPGCGDAYRAASYWRFTIVEDAVPTISIDLAINPTIGCGNEIVVDENILTDHVLTDAGISLSAFKAMELVETYGEATQFNEQGEQTTHFGTVSYSSTSPYYLNLKLRNGEVYWAFSKSTSRTIIVKFANPENGSSVKVKINLHAPNLLTVPSISITDADKTSTPWYANNSTEKGFDEVHAHVNEGTLGASMWVYGLDRSLWKKDGVTETLYDVLSAKQKSDSVLKNLADIDLTYKFVSPTVTQVKCATLRDSNNEPIVATLEVSEDGTQLTAKSSVFPKTVIATLDPYNGEMEYIMNVPAGEVLNWAGPNELSDGETLTARVGISAKVCDPIGYLNVKGGEFDVKFLRPLSVLSEQAEIADGTPAIYDVEAQLSFTNWRGWNPEQFALNTLNDFAEFYGLRSIKMDENAPIMTDYASSGRFVAMSEDLENYFEFAMDEVCPIVIDEDYKAHVVVKYIKHAGEVESQFQAKIPVILEYAWGKLSSEIVITVKPMPIVQSTLTFLVDGETYSQSTVSKGATITLPEAPTKDGYTFKGWEGLPEDMLMPGNDLTVTAIFEIILGDVNGDNEIDVADLSAIASYILGHPSESFVEMAADVNKDNEIDVADIAALAYLILHPETSFKVKARKVAAKKELTENTDNTLYAEMLQAEAGTDVVLPIMMRNSIEATGFQLDLMLPEGVTLKEATLSNARTSNKRTNLFDYARQADGSYRILCNSAKGLSFNGHDGEVMLLTLHIDKDAELGAQTIVLKDMVLTDATGMLREESSLSESTLWIGNATGIHEMASEKSATTYDLQGRQVSKKQKGIVISDGKKIMKK